MKKLVIIIVVFLAITTKAQTIKQLKKDMYGIASDATEGRFTASPGYLKAARYVAGQLRATGIKTTFQAVPFIWDNYNGSSLTFDYKTYPHEGGNFIILQYAAPSDGKWVVLPAMPDSVTTQKLIEQKVAGVILMPNQQQAADWETTVIRQYRFDYMHYAADYLPATALLNIIMVSPALAKDVKNNTRCVVNLRFKQDHVTGYNIIAGIAGTDKNLKNQTIITGAHLDHIGRVGKHIYNGANDDASGCVAEMQAARYFEKHPAKRPLKFVFFCGEELDLLGSRYLMDHPPVPVKNMLLSINLEQVGSKHRSFHGIWGLGDPQFQNKFFKSGSMFAGADLTYSVTDSVRDVLSNTDSYSFMKKNVPSLLLGSGGFDDHHRPEDKIDLIDFPHLQKASGLLISLINNVSN